MTHPNIGNVCILVGYVHIMGWLFAPVLRESWCVHIRERIYDTWSYHILKDEHSIQKIFSCSPAYYLLTWPTGLPFLGELFFWGPRRGTRSGYGLQALQGPATSCGQHRLHGLRHRSSPRWVVGICPATWAQWWSWSSTVQGLVVVPQAKRNYTAFMVIPGPLWLLFHEIENTPRWFAPHFLVFTMYPLVI